MSTICCPKSVKGLRIRTTRTDVCGVPESIFDAQTRITTKAFVSLTLTPNIEAGEEITVKLADGTLCLVEKEKDALKGLDLELLLCGVPLPLLEMMLGATVLTEDGNSVGGVLPSRTSQEDVTPVQLEVWSRNKDAASCAPGDASVPYMHWMLPLTNNWQLGGSLAFASAQLEVTLTGFGEETAAFEPSHSGEWTAGQITAIQAGGPLAWKCVNSLPDIVECDYDPIGSGL